MEAHTIHHLAVGSIAANCWIYLLDTTAAPVSGLFPCAVIDPGAEGSRIIARLDQLNLFPRYILLTHGHFDHIGAVPALAAEYSGRGLEFEIAVHAADAEYLGPDSLTALRRVFRAVTGNAEYVDTLPGDILWKSMPAPNRTFAEGDRVGPFTVLHLPGHSPGSVGLWDREQKVLFTGDTLFRGDYGRTDLPGGSETRIRASLQRLFGMDGDITVFPGHGPATAIERERQRGLLFA